MDSNYIYEVKCNKKYFFKFILWLMFGTAYLLAYKKAFLQKAITEYEYFVWVGALYFCVIGFLLKDALSLGSYFVFPKEMPKTTYSLNRSMISSAFDYFGYSALLILCFLISNHPFLLGGTFGLIFDGIICIFELKIKKQ